jgi:hypothetical protein
MGTTSGVYGGRNGGGDEQIPAAQDPAVARRVVTALKQPGAVSRSGARLAVGGRECLLQPEPPDERRSSIRDVLAASSNIVMLSSGVHAVL